jgi:hypothetical protein
MPAALQRKQDRERSNLASSALSATVAGLPQLGSRSSDGHAPKLQIAYGFAQPRHQIDHGQRNHQQWEQKHRNCNACDHVQSPLTQISVRHRD